LYRLPETVSKKIISPADKSGFEKAPFLPQTQGHDQLN